MKKTKRKKNAVSSGGVCCDEERSDFVAARTGRLFRVDPRLRGLDVFPGGDGRDVCRDRRLSQPRPDAVDRDEDHVQHVLAAFARRGADDHHAAPGGREACRHFGNADDGTGHRFRGCEREVSWRGRVVRPDVGFDRSLRPDPAAFFRWLGCARSRAHLQWVSRRAIDRTILHRDRRPGLVDDEEPDRGGVDVLCRRVPAAHRLELDDLSFPKRPVRQPLSLCVPVRAHGRFFAGHRRCPAAGIVFERNGAGVVHRHARR